MKNKIYLILNFILFTLSIFLLGSYTASIMSAEIIIEPYQWGLTTFFGLIFLFNIISNVNVKK